MCNACGMQCCASDQFEACGCPDCDYAACRLSLCPYCGEEHEDADECIDMDGDNDEEEDLPDGE